MNVINIINNLDFGKLPPVKKFQAGKSGGYDIREIAAYLRRFLKCTGLSDIKIKSVNSRYAYCVLVVAPHYCTDQNCNTILKLLKSLIDEKAYIYLRITTALSPDLLKSIQEDREYWNGVNQPRARRGSFRGYM